MSEQLKPKKKPDSTASKESAYWESLHKQEKADATALVVASKQPHGIMKMVQSGEVNNRVVVRSHGSLSMSAVLNSDLPTLSDLCKKYSGEQTEKVTGMIVQEASRYFGDVFSDDQADEIGTEIVQAYRWMKMEDIFVCLQRLKETDIKGRLTPNKVITAVKRYANERMNLAASQNYNEHLRLKEGRGNEQAEQAWFNGFKADIKKYHRHVNYVKEVAEQAKKEAKKQSKQTK